MGTILIVDEDIYVSRVLALFLEATYEAVAATDAGGVRDVLAECKPDLAIVDPAGCGEDALRVLRLERPCVPVVLMGTSLGELQQHALDHPGRFAGFIMKPFDNDRVLDVVEKLMTLSGYLEA